MMMVLPDDVTSPYRFSQHIKFMKMIPLLFNDIDTPPFGKLKEMRQWLPLQIWVSLEVKIFYKEHYKTRVVSHVEWLDSKQRLRSVDYYTKEGFKFAGNSLRFVR